jgi:hypothetical protein
MSIPPPTQSKPPRLSPALVGAGVLVIALGFGLPMLTSGAVPEPPPRDPTAKQGAPTPAPIDPPAATGLGASLLKLAVGMVVVCGVCVLGARWMRQKPPPAPGAMEVLASIAVAQCVLHLVRAGDRRLLVGTDLGGVKALVELPGPEPELRPDPPLAPAVADSAPADEPSVPLAPAPPTPAAPAPPAPLTQEEILTLLFRLHSRTGAPPPG